MADKVRIVMHSRNQMTLSGLTGDEADLMESVVLGAATLQIVEGRMKVHPHYRPMFPDPVDDPAVPQKWQRSQDNLRAKMDVMDMPGLDSDAWRSPSITIQHLCGYYRTDVGYKSEAAKLERYGFECLRSRRGSNGRFWELWLLPFLKAAEHELKNAIGVADGCGWQAETKAAVDFLARNCSFGTLDVCVQRLAMTID